MFYLSYIACELRRRKGRTLLTALGLGVGVGLVVTVTALSNGLDRAQRKVLAPLTGVGTDVSVTRPLKVNAGGAGFAGPGAGLSASERKQLEQENGGARIGLQNLGKPGAKFQQTNFVTLTQLSFPATTIGDVKALAGVADVAGGLTITALTVSGTVPKSTQPQGPPGAGATGGPPRNINFDQLSLAGVDPTHPTLAAISPGQIVKGSYLTAGVTRQAVLNISYARRKGLAVGDKLELKGRTFTIVGIAKTPIGGQASDAYLELDQLQRLSGRAGRVNVLYVRARRADAVGSVQESIERSVAGSSVTTSKDLADRVGGSLVDAKNLSSKLGTALAIAGLIAAFAIACLLTLSSVTKRIRELGTLKAIGWPQRLVVRQVTGESLAQGALGGIAGAVIGVAGAAVITAIGPTLKASVAAAASPVAAGPGPGAGPLGGSFGQGAVTSGSALVKLDAPVDVGLILLAVGLALLGGLLAGAVGGLRAARLRPADALRHIG